MKRVVQIEIQKEELLKFEKISGIAYKIKGNYSTLFLADLMAFHRLFGVGSDEVFMVLNDYEKGKNDAGIKAPTPFKHSLLKGLHHIHFTSSRYIAQNIKIGLGKNGLKNIINCALDDETKSINQQAKQISDQVVTGTLDRRKAKCKMTGEWVIYAKYNDELYYLCLARHNDTDQFIRNRIVQHCFEEFPFLKSQLNN
ncbi:hypothetical protein VCR15J2_470051 [Vibrio coralliirubri]|uniref:hypothetical protein n=1 Tax=Vibrio coralliirubri TaxID=1516159 RepID=UPI000632F7CB|nr:hypothetical protein [Vibrio coralliirubri]CDT62616.1 hypothetical protein VCR15J2_470051 [Vibrio coralliirubri]